MELRYDAKAAGHARKIGRAIRDLPGLIEFGALTNALETHVEMGTGHPEIVRAFAVLFRTMAEIRRVHPDDIAEQSRRFEALVKHLVS